MEIFGFKEKNWKLTLGHWELSDTALEPLPADNIGAIIARGLASIYIWIL